MYIYRASQPLIYKTLVLSCLPTPLIALQASKPTTLPGEYARAFPVELLPAVRASPHLVQHLTDHKKLAMKRVGPLEIVEVLGPLTYRLKLPQQWRIHDVFHASLLTPVRENDTHGPNFALPPPDLVEGEEEYEVEAITGHRTRYGRKQFLVKWKGYPTSENSWEPERNLDHAQKLLKAYKQLHHL